jgi:hypothetical protein
LRLLFDVEPSLIPEEDDLRDKLFPGWVAVTTDDREVKIVSRRAFPPLPSPTSAVSAAVMPTVARVAQAALSAAAERVAARSTAAAASAAKPGAAPGAMTTPASPGNGLRRRRRDE